MKVNGVCSPRAGASVCLRTVITTKHMLRAMGSMSTHRHINYGGCFFCGVEYCLPFSTFTQMGCIFWRLMVVGGGCAVDGCSSLFENGNLIEVNLPNFTLHELRIL